MIAFNFSMIAESEFVVGPGGLTAGELTAFISDAVALGDNFARSKGAISLTSAESLGDEASATLVLAHSY